MTESQMPEPRKIEPQMPEPQMMEPQMMEKWLWRLTWAIALITIASGAFQIVFAGWELDLLGSEETDTTRHFFAIVGMFMVLFGGVLCHALIKRDAAQVVFLWTALQKFGAFAAVGIGVLNSVFAELALFVAFFDLGSGVVIMLYRQKLK